jgi:hypothetical protein
MAEMNWTHPDIGSEMDEIEKTAKRLGLTKADLITAYTEGELKGLGDDVWSQLQNSDSYKIESEEQAKALSADYERDIESILEAMKDDGSLPAPIVLMLEDGTPYLVAGNTRLMAAKIKGIHPKVLMMQLPDQVEAAAEKIASKKISPLWSNG